MTDVVDASTIWILLVGLAVIASGLIEAGSRKVRIPSLVGYVLLGVLLSLLDSRVELLTEPVRHAFTVLADLGVVALLFRVGLHSHPQRLVGKLPEAVPIWVGNVAASGLLGFATAYYLLEVDLIPALVVGTALTATSVGVAVASWEEAGTLDSDRGQVLLDVAEMDDISAVALMALLFAVIPVLHENQAVRLQILASTGLVFAAKFSLFLGVCYLFSRYLEPRLTRVAARLEPEPQRMLTVVGVGLVIAAFANWLGFSLAIGALFAGLVFSRDPDAVKTEPSFTDLYAFVTPFFFINIGLHIAPEYVLSGAGLGAVLLVAAVVGKVAGAGMPALVGGGMAGAVLIGVSMVPRAEIAMVIMHQAQRLGDWALPEKIYAGMVFVSMMTCIAAPWILYRLLQRWPQRTGKSS